MSDFYDGSNIQILKAKQKIEKDFGQQIKDKKAVVQPYTLRVVQFIKNGESLITLNTSAKHPVKYLEDIEKKVEDSQVFYGYNMGFGVAKIPYAAENGTYEYYPGSRLPFSYPNADVFSGTHEGIKEIDAITNLFMSSIDFGRGYGSSLKKFDTSYFLSVPNFAGHRAGLIQKDVFKTMIFDSASNEIKITLPKGSRLMLSGIMTGVAKAATGTENILVIEMEGFLVSQGAAM